MELARANSARPSIVSYRPTWSVWHQDSNLVLQIMFGWLLDGVAFDSNSKTGVGDMTDK